VPPIGSSYLALHRNTSLMSLPLEMERKVGSMNFHVGGPHPLLLCFLWVGTAHSLAPRRRYPNLSILLPAVWESDSGQGADSSPGLVTTSFPKSRPNAKLDWTPCLLQDWCENGL
jgi:hypothetical protein